MTEWSQVISSVSSEQKSNFLETFCPSVIREQYEPYDFICLHSDHIILKISSWWRLKVSGTLDFTTVLSLLIILAEDLSLNYLNSRFVTLLPFSKCYKPYTSHLHRCNFWKRCSKTMATIIILIHCCLILFIAVCCVLG